MASPFFHVCHIGSAPRWKEDTWHDNISFESISYAWCSLGECIGTALRYACSVIPDCGAFHIGTFAANMAACFVYAALSAWLGGTRRTVGRAKEYVNRGCGMGMCGGLSTMSTLALEEFTMLHDGKAMDCAAYCCTTFIVGCLLAYVGAHVGLRFAGTEHNDGDRHAMGKEAD